MVQVMTRRTSLRNVAQGESVLVRRARPWGEKHVDDDYALACVEYADGEYDPENGRAAVRGAKLEDGTALALKYTDNATLLLAADGTAYTVVWSLPLPDLPFDKLLEYVNVLRFDFAGTMGTQPINRDTIAPAIFLLEKADDDCFRARMVSRSAHAERYSEPDEEPTSDIGGRVDYRPVRPDYSLEPETAGAFVVSRHEIAIRRADLPDAIEGDLVSSTEFGVRMEGDRAVTRLSNPRIVANITSIDGIEAVFPTRPDRDRTLSMLTMINVGVQMARISEHEYETQAALTSLTDDIALVLARPHDRDDSRTGYASIIDHRGELFFRSAIHMDGEFEEDEDMLPGLWVMKKPEWWGHTPYEGDPECGLNYEIEPATDASLALFGLNWATIGETLAGWFETDHEPWCSMTVAELGERFRELTAVANIAP
jgi:hypothetical protein